MNPSFIPFACAVCFGDPDSSLTKGTIAGVLFLLGVIVTVLGGILITGIVWTIRARKISHERLQ